MYEKHLNDDELLRAAQGGDETAFVTLYARHRDAIFRFAYRLLGCRDRAADITHDCFIALLKQPARYDAGQAALRTYLFAAARNLCFKHFRQHGREVAWDADATENGNYADGTAHAHQSALTATAPQPLDAVLRSELAARVQAAIETLPPLQREVLVLFEYEEMSLNEIAAVTAAEVNAVKARLHRARQNLKKQLSDYMQSNDDEASSLRHAPLAEEVHP